MQKQPLIERLGLEPVPMSLKTTQWWEYFMIQLAFSVNSGNFLVPALAVLEGGLSFYWAILSTVLGAGLAFLFVSILSLPGARYGLPGQFVIRTMIGKKLSMFSASPIRSLTSLYWFSVQTIGGTLVVISILEKWAGLSVPFLPVALSLALVMTVLALIGFDAVKKATKMFIPVLVVGQMILLYIFLSDITSGNVQVNETSSFSFSMFVFFASLAFVQYVSGVSASSDMTRYATNERHGFWGLYAGNVIGFTMTAILGSLSAELYQNSNPFVAASESTGSVVFMIIIIITAMVSMISINLSNAYTGGFSLLNALPQIGRLKSAILFGVCGIVLSAFPTLVENAESYISWLGAFVVPLSAIIVTDFILIKKKEISEEDLIQLAEGKATYNHQALATLLTMIVFYIAIPDQWSPGFITFVATSVVYYSLMSMKVNRNVRGQRAS